MEKEPHGEPALVTDFSWLNLSTLDGIEDYARELYGKSEYLEPVRIETLANALRTRIELLGGIARGQAIL